MVHPKQVRLLVRGLPHLGARHDEDHEMLPGHADFLGGFFDEGLTVPSGTEDALVVHDN